LPATPSQRRGLMVLLAIILVILAIRLSLNPVTVPDPQPAEGPLANQLADHIDPNTAGVAELAAIPTLGEKRAEAIVEYREQYSSRHPGRLAFATLSDLEKISGIGTATTETLESYLIFPSATTRR